MPSLTSHPYAALIPLLPVADHSVEVDAAKWLPIFQAANLLPLHGQIFGSNQTVRLTRNRLQNHPYSSPDQKVVEILLWGYPTNLHGLVGGLLPQLAALTTLACRSTTDWYFYFDSFRGIRGVNLSTITKFAYFHRLTFADRKAGTLHPALILDDRLLANLPRWSQVAMPALKRITARTHYVAYLARMEQAAAPLGASADQLELFLFTLGRSF